MSDIFRHKKEEYIVSLEEEVAKNRKKGILQKIILTTLFSAGLITVATVAPNIFRFFGPSLNKAKLKYRTKSAISKLVEKGYVEFVGENGKKLLHITNKGKVALELALQKLKKISKDKKKNRKWDKKWRMVIFDVPEYRRSDRDKLRETMREFGFYRLQDSVWIYPYDCEEIVALLKADLEIGKSVLYAIVEKLEYDTEVQKYFGLFKETKKFGV